MEILCGSRPVKYGLLNISPSRKNGTAEKDAEQCNAQPKVGTMRPMRRMEMGLSNHELVATTTEVHATGARARDRRR